MSSASPLERLLLRISFALKVLMWAALAATLVAGIWDVATGGHSGPPSVLIWSVVVLIGLQAITLFAWYLLWKARVRKDKQ